MLSKSRFKTAVFLIVLLASGAVLGQKGENGIVVEVKNRDGQPLRDACVTVIPKQGEITLLKANREGRVKLKKMTPGSYRVVVRVDGYEAQKREVTIGSAVEAVAFSLERRGAYQNE